MSKVGISRLLVGMVVLTFVTVVSFLVFHDYLGVIDQRVLAWAGETRTDFGITFFGTITWLGKWYVVMIASLAALVGFYKNFQLRKFFTPLIVLLLGTASSVYVLKELFHRSRPGEMLPTFVEESFAFPSGHAAIAMALYGFLWFVIVKTVADRGWRLALSSICASLVVLIGFSRLYLGVHFFTDVWGGYLVGLWWVLIAVMCTEMALFKKKS